MKKIFVIALVIVLAVGGTWYYRAHQAQAPKSGPAGNDRLIGGDGNDTFTGGAGGRWLPLAGATLSDERKRRCPGASSASSARFIR